MLTRLKRWIVSNKQIKNIAKTEFSRECPTVFLILATSIMRLEMSLPSLLR